MYDPKHRFHVISTDPGQAAEYEQKGLREPLLCDRCEGQFSRYEGHANEALFGSKSVATPLPGGLGRTLKVDYRMFRLFVLSLIWRMGESRLEMFARVNLGPHAEIIRQALLAEDPMTADRYPFFVHALTMGGQFREDMILEPDFFRIDHYRGYRLIVHGLLFVVFVSNQGPPAELEVGLFTPSSAGLLVFTKDVTQIPYLSQVLQRLGAAILNRDR